MQKSSSILTICRKAVVKQQKGSEKMSIGEIIKEYMNKNGIKQTFVSGKTGIRKQILGQILLGKRKILTEEYFEICMALDINPIEFAEKAQIYKAKEDSATA